MIKIFEKLTKRNKDLNRRKKLGKKQMNFTWVLFNLLFRLFSSKWRATANCVSSGQERLFINFNLFIRQKWLQKTRFYFAKWYHRYELPWALSEITSFLPALPTLPPLLTRQNTIRRHSKTSTVPQSRKRVYPPP